MKDFASVCHGLWLLPIIFFVLRIFSPCPRRCDQDHDGLREHEEDLDEVAIIPDQPQACAREAEG